MSENKKLLDAFFQFEQNKKLFELQKDDLFVWDVLRYFVFGKLLMGNGYFAKTIRKGNSISYYFRVGINILQTVGNLFFKKYKYVFIIDSRYFDQNSNSYYDRNFREILDCLQSDSLVIELNKNGISKNYLGATRFFSFPFLFGIARFLSPKKEKYEFQNLISSLSDEFTLPKDLQSGTFYNFILDEFTALCSILKSLFKIVRPKAVFYGQYNLKACVKVCNELGIDSIEVQHGRIQLDHLFYSYPKGIDNTKQIYTPTHFLTYSKYWFSRVNFPISGDYVPIGNSEISQNDKKNIADANSILLVDGLIGHADLSEFLLELLERGLASKITYKLHPDQFADKQQISEKYKSFPNVTVVSNEVATSELVSKHRIGLLVQSTVAFEILDAGGKCLILKAKGHELIQELFNHDNVFLIEDYESFQSASMQPTKTQSIEKKFFTPFNKKLFMEWMRNKGYC